MRIYRKIKTAWCKYQTKRLAIKIYFKTDDVDAALSRATKLLGYSDSIKEGKEKEAFRSIGLALNASHNTIATDDVNAKTNKTSWRINHEKEIAALDWLERVSRNSDSVCNGRNNAL